MITNDPIGDAQDYFKDEKPEYEHICESCKRGFNEGSQFDTEKFCKECVEEGSHLWFYRGLGLNDGFIYENILSTEIIINN